MEQTIMVVEDDKMIRDLIGLYLKKAGHSVVEAADGEEAKEVFRESHPCMVILDLMLPYRMEKSRSRELGGSGLGLAISSEIIEGHNGKIGLTSDGNQHTFWFELPVLHPESSHQPNGKIPR
jgi:CheY-like chemotaxis protein